MNSTAFHIEPWAEFRDHTPPEVPYVIDAVVPVGSVGFVGAGKGCGKTWVSLAAALCTATGRPFFGRFAVAAQRPVVYVALEGARSNLRARIGALTRGLDLDPDCDALANLHVLYKPRINLLDRLLTATLIAEILERDPGLVIFDVLRKAAHVRESNEGTGDFLKVLENTAPLVGAGSAVIFDHHNTKPTDKPDQRQAGERLSGSGALHGHADFGVFITGYDRRNRVLTVEFSTRDEAELGEITVRLIGDGSGRFGGFTYTDRCVVTSEAKTDAQEQRQETHEQVIRRHLGEHPRANQAAIVEAVGGKRADLVAALDGMITRGEVLTERGPRNSILHWLADDPSRPVPDAREQVGTGEIPGASCVPYPKTPPIGGVGAGTGQSTYSRDREQVAGQRSLLDAAERLVQDGGASWEEQL